MRFGWDAVGPLSVCVARLRAAARRRATDFRAQTAALWYIQRKGGGNAPAIWTLGD